jgi:hypothetical protein
LSPAMSAQLLVAGDEDADLVLNFDDLGSIG